MNELYRNEESDILTFKLILELNNNWEEYKKNDDYKVRDVEIREVEKMLRGDFLIENYIAITINEMLKVKSDYTNINDLIRWARKTLANLKSDLKDDDLKYILIKTILTRLSNIYFDITAFENDFVEGKVSET